MALYDMEKSWLSLEVGVPIGSVLMKGQLASKQMAQQSSVREVKCRCGKVKSVVHVADCLVYKGYHSATLQNILDWIRVRSEGSSVETGFNVV